MSEQEGGTSEALKIEYIGGNCPVQAKGTINGTPFYFRARGEHWSFGVGNDPIGEPAWYHCEAWGDGPFTAGWMDEATARQLIEWCACAYLARAAIAKAEGKEVA